MPPLSIAFTLSPFQISDLALEQWVQAEHNAFFMCDKFEKPHWLELLPAEGPDSDAFDEELNHEYCQYHASFMVDSRWVP